MASERRSVRRFIPSLTKGVDSESLFRTERTLKANEIGGGVVIPVPSTDAYSPYGEKWKEFDKLEKRVKAGYLSRIHYIIWSVILPAIGLLDRHRFSHKNDLWLLASGILVALIDVVRTQAAKKRFAEWPCPRCGTKWPGTKTEREPKCAICGLKLHQLVP